MAPKRNEIQVPILLSTICSLPTIEICLRQPAFSQQKGKSSDRDALMLALADSQKRSKLSGEEGDSTTELQASGSPDSSATPNIIPPASDTGEAAEPSDDHDSNTDAPAIFHVHVAALTTHSRYFKSLISFDGLEVKQNRVVFECPTDCDPKLNKLAFQCFIDFLYTGTYDIMNYPFQDNTVVAGGGEYKPATGDAMVFYSILYVLGEKLLSEEFQKMVLKDIFTLLVVYQRASEKRLEDRTKEEKILSLIQWEHLIKAAHIVFSGTSSKAVTALVGGIESETALDSNDTQRPIKNSKSRKYWLGGEYMRNLIAAFLSNLWQTAEAKEADVTSKKALIEQTPDIQQYLLAYLLIPGYPYNRKLESLPKSEFGISDGAKDGW